MVDDATQSRLESRVRTLKGQEPHPLAVPFLLEAMAYPDEGLRGAVKEIFVEWSTEEGKKACVPALLAFEGRRAYHAAAAQALELVVLEKDLPRLRALWDEAQKGIKNKELLVKRVGYRNITDVIRVAHRYGITLPEGVYQRKRRPEIDALVMQGYGETDIARRLGRSRQWINGYLVKTNQLDRWRQVHDDSREKKKKEKTAEHKAKTEENEVKRGIVALVQQRFLAAAEQEGWRWAAEKTLEYYNAKTRTSIEPRKLTLFFRAYGTARANREKYSIGELGRIAGIEVMQASRILRTVNLDPLWYKGDKPTYNETKQRKERVQGLVDAGIPFSNNDIAYFLGMRYNAIRAWIWNQFSQKPRGRVFQHAGWKKLTYCLASRLYEARDLGFTAEERCILFDVPKETVRYADEHRREIGEDIEKGLRCLHPDREITKPYLVR